MAELTPKERVMRLLRKEPIDTMPFFSGMGMVVMPGIEKSGYKFATVHTDAERMASSAIWSAKLMGFDCVVIPYDMTMESEAMGNQISLYADTEDILYPTIPEKIWSTMDEVVIPENIVELGRLPLLPKAIEIIKILSTFKKHDDWWLNHIIDLPNKFLYELDALCDSKIIGSEIDILSAHDKHISLIKRARELKLITPVFYSGLIDSLFERIGIEENLKTEVIVTPRIIKYITTIKIRKNSKLIRVLNSPDIEIMKTKDDLKMGLTLTEKTMML